MAATGCWFGRVRAAKLAELCQPNGLIIIRNWPVGARDNDEDREEKNTEKEEPRGEETRAAVARRWLIRMVESSSLCTQNVDDDRR